MRVYIASAYSNGDVALNVREAISTADKLVGLGHTPYIPHLTHFWHLISPKDYEFWLEYDRSFIEHWAECLLRLDNESVGADKEVVRARKLGIPVYYSLLELERESDELQGKC